MNKLDCEKLKDRSWSSISIVYISWDEEYMKNSLKLKHYSHVQYIVFHEYECECLRKVVISGLPRLRIIRIGQYALGNLSFVEISS